MRLKPNEFSSYDLSQQEEAQGWNFGLMTQAVLRNELAKTAAEILSARVEKKDQLEEERKHLAYLQGQKDILMHILAQCAMYSQDLDLAVQEEQQNDTPQ